jgi:hypothetical protein
MVSIHSPDMQRAAGPRASAGCGREEVCACARSFSMLDMNRWRL